MSIDRLKKWRNSVLKASAILKVWESTSGWKAIQENGVEEAGLGNRIQPLPIAIRLDTSLDIGTKGFIPASKLIWVSPSRDDLTVKTLEAVLIPN
mgnify:CR=1 FL=1